MLYYVKTGYINTSLQANSHKHAAIKILESSSRVDCGTCMIVSKKRIVDPDRFQVYFLTDNIMLECGKPFMRLVD